MDNIRRTSASVWKDKGSVLNRMNNFCEGSSLYQTLLLLHQGKWRFGCFGRFRQVYHCKNQNPSPIGESENLDVLGWNEKCLWGSSLHQTLHPTPLGKVKIWMFLGDLDNFTIASIRTPIPSPIGESKGLDVLGDLEILPLQVPLCICCEICFFFFFFFFFLFLFCFVLLLQVPEPPPSPNWEKWRFGCLGRFRQFCHCKYQNASLSSHWGKWRFGCLGRFRKCYHCQYQNLPSRLPKQQLAFMWNHSLEVSLTAISLNRNLCEMAVSWNHFPKNQF